MKFQATPTRLLGTILVVLCFVTYLQGQEATPNADKALDRLKAGNDRFVADKPLAKDTGDKKRKELAKDQHPFAIVLTCADSRVAPEMIFDQGLGELFVIRVAGNVADAAVLGSIEYAVEHLKSPLVVVLGHDECGAVKAALSGEKVEGNLGKLIAMVDVGKNLPKDKKEALSAGVAANARNQTAALTAKSDVLKDFISSKRVRIVTGVYSLESGKVSWLDTADKDK